MELARSENELNKPRNWGKIIYHKMKRDAESGKGGLLLKEKKNIDFRVREFLENFPVVSGTLDATEIISSLSDDQLCCFFIEFDKCRALIMRSWKYISSQVLRAISVAFTNLVELDMSYSGVCNAHLEVLVLHLHKVEVLVLDGCEFLDSMCMATVAKLIGSTMRELYVSRCPYFKVDPLLYIGGCIGVNAPKLAKLALIDLMECPVKDNGLTGIAACRQLQYINLESCFDITDKGCISIANGCKKLRVLNLSGCVNISSKTVRALGANCHNLRSLNLNRCVKVSDAAVQSMVKACPQLQALSLVAITNITETTMYEICQNCKGILMLNVSGCDKITVNGVKAVIRGLQYVEMSQQFFGFQPIDRHVEEKLKDQLNSIRKKSLREARELEERELRRREEENNQREDLLNSSSMKISRNLRWYSRSKYFRKLVFFRLQNVKASIIQRNCRGKLARLLRKRVTFELAVFMSLSPHAINIQRLCRGHLGRHGAVGRLIFCRLQEMYTRRRREAETGTAVRLQSHARLFLARRRVRHLKELWERGNLNRYHAATLIQKIARARLAWRLVQHMRLLRARREELEQYSAILIQKFYLDKTTEYRRAKGLSERNRFRDKVHINARHIQRFYRGHRARERVQKIYIALATEIKAALTIQRISRGLQVMHWRDIRRNVLASYALDRHCLERKDRSVAARQRYRDYVHSNTIDSASESEEENDQGGAIESEGAVARGRSSSRPSSRAAAAALEEEYATQASAWLKKFDGKRRKWCWVNQITQEITFVEPPTPFAHELSMINLRVQVYWVVQQQWYEGVITKFNKVKRRHRIDYDDGDHEWMDFNSEYDRVQIRLEDGSWIMYLLYRSPGQLNEWSKLEETRKTENAKKQAFDDANQWEMITDATNDFSSVIFMSRVSGEIRTGVDRAWVWAIQADTFGFPVFYNTETRELVQDDPRFEENEDADLTQKRKYVMDELRFAMYFCLDYWERYCNALDAKTQTRLMMQIRRTPKRKHLSALVIRARALFKQTSVVDAPVFAEVIDEIGRAERLSGNLNDVATKAEAHIVSANYAKALVVAELTGKGSNNVVCKSCGNATKKSLDFCLTCGHRNI